MSYKLQAGAEKVIVLQTKKEEVSKAGLILVDGNQTISEGKIVAIKSKEVNADIGDTVYFHKQTGLEITIDNIKYHVINAQEVLAILTKEK